MRYGEILRHSERELTDLGRDKMATIFRMTLYNTCSDFDLYFTEICSPRFNKEQARIGSDNSLAPNRQHVFIWTIDGLFYWRIYASLSIGDSKSALVLATSWCCQSPSFYLSQCWPRSISSHGVTRQQCVDFRRCFTEIFLWNRLIRKANSNKIRYIRRIYVHVTYL